MAMTFSTPAHAADDTAHQHKHVSKGWHVDVGMVTVDSTGITMRPQMLFGVHVENFSAEAGLHDLRDGLKVSAQAQAAMIVHATGMSLQELHESIAIDMLGLREALDAAKSVLSSNAGQLDSVRLADLARSLRISPELLEVILTGRTTNRVTPMTLKVTATVGVGLSATVCLGWRDSQGYNMYGVGGGASAILAMENTVFVGFRQKDRSAKVVLGIHNFKFEYTFPIGSIEGQCPACDGCGFVESSCFMGFGVTDCPKCCGGGQIE